MRSGNCGDFANDKLIAAKIIAFKNSPILDPRYNTIINTEMDK